MFDNSRQKQASNFRALPVTMKMNPRWLPNVGNVWESSWIHFLVKRRLYSSNDFWLENGAKMNSTETSFLLASFYYKLLFENFTYLSFAPRKTLGVTFKISFSLENSTVLFHLVRIRGVYKILTLTSRFTIIKFLLSSLISFDSAILGLRPATVSRYIGTLFTIRHVTLN